MCDYTQFSKQAHYFYPYFAEEETEAGRVKVTCSVVKAGFASHALAMLLTETLLLPHTAENWPCSFLS